ncbi:peroxidase 60 [Aristolochia californica]|uniref:peroxidase 60 n=1 Tax=Aristolochia californica TaxID=171875 RepID=UPI0035E2AFE8
MKISVEAITFLLLLVVANCPGFCGAALQYGYYDGKCGVADVEDIIRRVVTFHFLRNQTITPALLRLQFHDCFVRGCDASILLDVPNSEKTAGPNRSVRGYDIVDDAKAAVEAACPGVVSCADIIVAATRDAVELSRGERYEVPMGRLDGLVSSASNVDLPSPSISVTDSIQAFSRKRLSVVDMVLLLGGHTVGIAHCSLFQNRLYNFQNTRKPDPTMDPKLVMDLMKSCPTLSTVDNAVNLDQNSNSALVVDNSYYIETLARRGILQIDQALALDDRTSSIVKFLARDENFPMRFGNAMVKLSTVDVVTDINKGQIRKSCRAVKK